MLFFAVFTAFGQNQGKISGRIVDDKGNSPIQDAAVQLTKNSDSTIISGAATDADGRFTLAGISYGTYHISVKYIGYSPINIYEISLSEQHKDQSFDSLKLRIGDAKTEEINVEGEKSLMTIEGDKKVFNTGKMLLTKGGTALDVLKKVPLVDVDINDNVSLRGSQNVKILVNDQPSHYASLKQVPADLIDKVEIITNPPAKYEAEGVTGIINLVMKKSDLLGITGNANLGGSYVKNFRGWSGADINFKKNKWTVFSSINGGIFNFNFNYNALTNYFAPVSSLNVLGGGDGSSKYFWAQGGAEYEITPGKTFGFESSYSLGKWGNLDNSTSNNYDNTNTLSSYYVENAGRNGTWGSFNSNLYLNMKLGDKGQELNTSVSFARNKNTNDFFQVKHDFNANSVELNNTPRDQRDSIELASYNINAQVDYTHPLTQNTKFETGYKGTYRSNDNNFQSDTLIYPSYAYTTDEGVSNRFKLTEYINAVYGVYSGAIGDKFTYKLGMRLEQTNSTGSLLNNGTNFKKSYLDYFPSVNLSQKIGKADQLTLSYSRRITRPNIWRMNPFVSRHDARFWQVGNPDLNPEYTNSYELSFMLSTPVVTVTPLVFYRQSTGIISAYSRLIDSSIAVTTFRNAAGSKAYGTDLLINSAAISWMNINASLSFYNTKFDSDALTDYSAEEGFSWKANIRSTITFGGLFNIELFYRYTGKKVNAQGINEPTSNFDIGLSRSMLKDALSLSLRASDVFNTNKYAMQTNAASYSTVFHNTMDSRQVSLNLSYRFGNTKDQYRKKNNTKRNTNENNDSQDPGN